MILEYHRPKTIEEALSLLGRSSPRTVPLGGGTVLSAPGDRQVAVVDLQDLPLGDVILRGHELGLGATLTLEGLLAVEALPGAVHEAARQEATANLRRMATLAGTLVSADGRSPLTTALLALDVRLNLLPGDEEMRLGDFLPIRGEKLLGRLITRVTAGTTARLSYEQAARTPADWPLVCAAVAQWPSGRTRVALGGHGPAPVLAFDGPRSTGLDVAVEDAFTRAGDQWATAAYRQEVAGVLARRGLAAVEGGRNAS